MKKNCWEFKRCAKGEGCPAYTEWRLDGIHEGDNAGRACWMVAGTLCGGKVQGVFAQKITNCEDCDFYRLVAEEEGKNFQFSEQLLQNMI